MGDYLDLGGQQIYYEEYGAGEPLFLLHGGFVGAECWAAQVPELAKSYHVFVPERRGHGHTADVPGPYTTEIFAAETAAVIEALVGGPAHVIGWSDGAYIAAHLGLYRPDLVNRLVLIGMCYSSDGETEAVRAMMHDPNIADWFREEYAATSPDGPDHFDVVFEKVMALWRNPLELPLTEFAGLAAPTLVLQGDDDGVRLDYSAALAGTIPDAQLAVIPGTGHGAPMQKPGLVNRMILDFLVPEQPERMIAMGALHDPAR
ncbi:MAG TPA: alpha/beta hydrolase [Micromonosporaceae bacterium]